ncbi:MarR family transcriptional regulator [Hymenobacter sp. BT507]|uniref:MarR family transcriptional regulator n=1 Tax=Hymenobacter citatus TaxID=2763506 RepID=A0ABR7ML79_9BACT|nr:MarR family transcriptional regulator [Hymenobacter citatus]MBC6611851.1 MarR family transcriptional regulator [Hymenobacter citatus]
MAQAPEPTTSEEDFSLLKLENQLCFPLYAASRQLTKAYQPYLRELDPDLTYPQYLVLLLLWEHQEMTVKELGENLLLDSGTLTPLLKRMEQKQWVSRRRDPRDERSVIIGLSPAGEALHKPACAIPQGLFRQLAISMKEIATMRRLLDHIIKRLT